MTFWLGVAVAYVLIIAVGLALGLELSRRYPGKPGGGGRGPEPTPETPGPSFGLDWTDFDAGFLAASKIAADLPAQRREDAVV